MPRKLAFAVVEMGPTQFRVSQGDMIVTEKLRGVDVNDKISLNRVLMLGSPDETIIGRPFIPEASVVAAVEVSCPPGTILCTCLLGCPCAAQTMLVSSDGSLPAHAGAISGWQGADLQEAATEALAAHERPPAGQPDSFHMVCAEESFCIVNMHCQTSCKLADCPSFSAQHLTTLRILEINGIDAETPTVDTTKPKWWQARKGAASDADAVAAVVA